MFKNNLKIIRDYIFIFLTATILLILSTSKLTAKENIFTVEDIKIEGSVDLSFTREKFIDRAFKKAFNKLLSKILILEDQAKLKNLKLNEIKNLIFSFKILDEKINNKQYLGTFEVLFNDIKIKQLLSKKNISFFEPKNTSVVFFPVLFINNEVKIFDENYFYKNWLMDYSKDETIKFILPLEDLEDIRSVSIKKNDIEKMNFKNIAKKYNIENYATTIMSYEKNELKVYVKTSLDSKEYSENILYELKDWKDKARLSFIIKDLRIKILDMWKKANLINVPSPLNILVQFKFDKLKDLDNLEEIFQKINVINKYSLEKFDIKNSFFKINYYGNPMKLNEEFAKFKYNLKDNQGYWELEKYE